MKRLISLLLVFAMVISILPLSIFAEDGEDAALDQMDEVKEMQEDLPNNGEILPPSDGDEGEEKDGYEVDHEEENLYASWTGKEIHAEYIRLMEAEDYDALDTFLARLSSEQQSALMAALSTVIDDKSAEQSAAATGTCGKDLTWTLDSDGTLTISGTGNMADYDYDKPTPWDSKAVKCVVLESGVTSIGSGAFSDCTNLSSVTIPSGITSIGDDAFGFCSRLRNIILPDSVTYIGFSAFRYTGLNSITLPDKVTTIGTDAFFYCSSLTEISVSERNLSYRSQDGVLFNRSKTELVIYPSGKADSLYRIPDGVTSIGDGAFAECNNLTTVTFPASLTSLGNYTFRFSSNLTSVTLPSSVTAIGIGVFRGCTGLKSITIPSSITSIGNYAFEDCSSLSNVYYSGSESQWQSIKAGDNNDKLLNAKIYYSSMPGENTSPDDVTVYAGNHYKIYHLTMNWSEAKEYCEKLGGHLAVITSADEQHFLDSLNTECANLWIGGFREKADGDFQWVTGEDMAYTNWGEGEPNNSSNVIADEWCIAVWPNQWNDLNNASREQNGFICEWENGELEWNIDANGTLTVKCIGKMPDFAEKDTPWHDLRETIRAVIIEEGATSIGYGAFQDCRNLTEVTIGKSVKTIELGAFWGCGSLTCVTIPKSVTNIGYGAFAECSQLADVYYLGSEAEWNAIQIELNPDLEKAEKHFAEKKLEKIEDIHYLAFSELAYKDWTNGDTIRSGLQKMGLWEANVYSELPGLTYAILCNDIADWKVVYTPRWRIEYEGGYFEVEESYSAGFYAVAFQGETNNNGVETVIAYRGSESISLDTIGDPALYDDWLKNDLPFQVDEKYTSQLDDALKFYGNYIQHIEQSGDTAGEISLTGHSLGGALASVTSMKYGNYAEVFNSAYAFIALYKNRMDLVAEQFQGIDKWNIRLHHVFGDLVSGWLYYYDEFAHYCYPQVSDDSFKNHGLKNFLIYDTNSEKVSMKSPVQTSNGPSKFFAHSNLLLGTSGDDPYPVSWVRKEYSPNDNGGHGNIKGDDTYFDDGPTLTLYGGDGQDKLTIVGRSSDVLIGGKGDDILDGDNGDDIYHYYKGGGCDTIHDASGYDKIILHNFDWSDSVSYTSDSEYITVYGNDWPILKISRNRQQEYPILIYDDCNQRLKLTEFNWKEHVQSISSACPTDVDILDSNGNVVLTMENGVNQTTYTDFGNFYVFDDENGESVKYADLVEGYSFRIRGVGEGTMQVTYYEDGGEEYILEDVPVTIGMIATIDGGEIPVLMIDMNQDGVIDETLPLRKPDSVKCEKLMLDDLEETQAYNEVWIDGIKYPIAVGAQGRYVSIPTTEASMMIVYDYHTGDSNDPHMQYPVGMKVWALEYENGSYTATYVPEFDNILQYAGSSIRVTGNKGIRMITSINQSKKSALVGTGLAGYKLVEYGTLLAQTSKLGDSPLVLGGSNVKSNYAYKRNVADPVFNKIGNLMQYTNVLVGFTDEQCAEDIAMRPYMIVEDANGEQFTIYGGTIYRSIGYIAYQNRNSFTVGSDAYQYVWSIIHNVYGNAYDSEYRS